MRSGVAREPAQYGAPRDQEANRCPRGKWSDEGAGRSRSAIALRQSRCGRVASLAIATDGEIEAAGGEVIGALDEAADR